MKKHCCRVKACYEMVAGQRRMIFLILLKFLMDVKSLVKLDVMGVLVLSKMMLPVQWTASEMLIY